MGVVACGAFESILALVEAAAEDQPLAWETRCKRRTFDELQCFEFVVARWTSVAGAAKLCLCEGAEPAGLEDQLPRGEATRRVGGVTQTRAVTALASDAQLFTRGLRS